MSYLVSHFFPKIQLNLVNLLWFLRDSSFHLKGSRSFECKCLGLEGTVLACRARAQKQSMEHTLSTIYNFFSLCLSSISSQKAGKKGAIFKGAWGRRTCSHKYMLIDVVLTVTGISWPQLCRPWYWTGMAQSNGREKKSTYSHYSLTGVWEEIEDK